MLRFRKKKKSVKAVVFYENKQSNLCSIEKSKSTQVDFSALVIHLGRELLSLKESKIDGFTLLRWRKRG